MSDHPTLSIDPRRHAAFGPRGDEAAVPCVVALPGNLARLDVPDDVIVRPWPPHDDLAAVLAGLPEPAHVLVVAPGRLVTSPHPDEIGRRKLVCLPAASTPMPTDALAHFLDVSERTDPADLEERADRFFAAVEATDHLVLVDRHAGTTARFDHLDPDYAWNQQAGVIGWGEQQIAPAGELSVLPADVMSFDHDARLALTGRLTLRGTPIVHAGARTDPADQQRRFRALNTLTDGAVLVSVEDGLIVGHEAAGLAARPAAEALDELFADDPRYRVVAELGVGINPLLEPQPGNRSMNEVSGGPTGCVHIGLGLTPATAYAPIFLCPGTALRTAEDDHVAGPVERPARRLNRGRSAACGCNVPAAPAGPP